MVAASLSAAWGQTAKPKMAAITNVASYGNGPISPGEMVVIFGSGMGPSSAVGLQLDQQGRVANTLSQVQVLFDGNPAPLIYVSATQISAMVPYGVAGKSSTQIQVVYQGNTSDSLQKPIAPSAPGIFTADSSGQGQGAMTNSDGSYNTSSNPATPGSYVTLYLTGEGQTDPSGSDGNIATSTANVALPVTVLIAGRTAQLLYAGSAPGNVNGFAQINAIIPADLPYGGNLPLVVKIGGIASQSGVTLAVSGPPAPIPGVPQGLSASSNASGQIVLAWTPADGLAARFHVERQIAGAGPFTEIAVVPVPAATFTDTGVTAGISYQYRARAENDYGFSAYSAVATGTIPAAQLTPPSNVQAVSASQTQINLTWGTANTNATKFHIERKSGATGAYAEITAAPSTATAYQDITVQPSTTYTYRIRSEGATGGLSSYSNETSATTPALPLPPAPSLQGTATSASQVHLSWTTTATGILLFSVERRTTTSGYSQISQPAATSALFDDSGLTGLTTYLYRMRVQTGSGFSPYSNEVTVTTLQALPAAPTNLQATAFSSNQVNLTWTNNAPDATAIRVESQPAGAASFTDIGAAATLTSTGIANLQPNTTYSFRVRAQNSAGFSAYSTTVSSTTLAPKATVFLIHGISQGSADMNSLAWSLGSPQSPDHLDLNRFQVDSGFDWHLCANNPSCNPTTCTIPNGAASLASYIASKNPPGEIILLGYSLGGLLARQLMVSSALPITAVATLGTPNVGYPSDPEDKTGYLGTGILAKCPVLVDQMSSDWRTYQASNQVVESSFLLGLNATWGATPVGRPSLKWLAVAGIFCGATAGDQIRSVAGSGPNEGCPDKYPYSDGVVCQVSAWLSLAVPMNTPTDYYSDATFAHADNTLLCFWSKALGSYNVLYKPPMNSPLLARIRSFLSVLP